MEGITRTRYGLSNSEDEELRAQTSPNSPWFQGHAKELAKTTTLSQQFRLSFCNLVQISQAQMSLNCV